MGLKPGSALMLAALKLAKLFDRRDNSQLAFDPELVSSILVVSSTAIGDTLLSTPAFRAVRERYPSARIIALLNAGNMSLFASNPDIDGIVPYHGGYRKFIATILALRQYHFNLALILHGNEPQATPMAYLAGARFIFKLPNKNDFRFLLTNSAEIYTWDDFTHAVEQRLQVAQLAGCVPGDRRMILPLQPDAGAAAGRFLQDSKIGDETVIIGFQPGASTISRMWFAERFVLLGKELLSRMPAARIVITGSPQEAPLCHDIARGIGAGATVSAGILPLPHLPALLQRFALLVTGDTGIMHMAIAAGTPVVALFAVADPRKSGPYYDLDRHLVIKKERTCDPCKSKKCTYQQCMEQIGVDEVRDAVLTVLERTGRLEHR